MRVGPGMFDGEVHHVAEGLGLEGPVPVEPSAHDLRVEDLGAHGRLDPCQDALVSLPAGCEGLGQGLVGGDAPVGVPPDEVAPPLRDVGAAGA